MPIVEVDQPVAQPGTRITKLAFLSRFTDEEAINIDIASIGATKPAATVRRYLNLVDAATFIDLGTEKLRTNLEALEASGLLAEGRAAEIIDAPIDPVEIPL